MLVRVTINSDLIDAAGRVIGAASDQNRIRIVILEGKAAVRRRQSRHWAQADTRVGSGKRVNYLRPENPRALSQGRGRVRLIICRSCPPGQRATDSGRGEKKRCRDSAMFSVHAIYKRVLRTVLHEIVLFPQLGIPGPG